jgi:arabinogalactan oligomer/maltooligosaccharide transport system substrate-binding protein
MKMKKLVAVSLACAMALPLAACSSSDSSSTSSDASSSDVTDVTLTVWTPQEDQSDDYGNWLGKMEANFEEAHPEYNITWKNGVVQEGDIGDTVTQDPTNSADVYLFANDQIGKLLDANAIAELGGSTLDTIKETNSEIVVDSVTQDGAVYGVPFTTNTWFMYYNKSIFSEEDVKTFEAMLEKGTVTFPLTNSWYIPAFYLADGGTMFGESGDDAAAGIDFDEPAVTEYLVDLVANSNFKVDQDGSGFAAFSAGEVGCMFSGSWDYQNLKDALGDDLGAVQLPTIEIDGEAKQLKSFAGTKAVGVNPNAANPAAAVAFAAYLGSEEAQKEHWELRSIIPTNTELLKDPEIGDNELVKAQNDTVDNTSIIQPTITEMGNYWTIGENFGKAIANGEVTLSNAVEKTTAFQENLDKSCKG